MAMIPKKPLFLPLVAIITTFFVLLHKVNSSIEVVQFDFPKFDESSAKDLILEGNATIVPSSNALRLTDVVDGNGNQVTYQVGRVSYSKNVHLWNASSGAVAGFTTSFVFRITSPGSGTNPGDGLTFFIASPTFPIGTAGGNLGLIGGPIPASSSSGSSDTVVAIEFDTHSNPSIGDPSYKHVGVDVNSITSIITKEWEWVNGDGVQVTITYGAYDKVLRVIVSDFSGPRLEFTYNIDLTAELPEWVRVGFTAATGGAIQSNDIIDWSFYSVLESNYVAEEDAHLASVV